MNKTPLKWSIKPRKGCEHHLPGIVAVRRTRPSAKISDFIEKTSVTWLRNKAETTFRLVLQRCILSFMDRKSVPQNIQDRVLLRSRRRCCICFGLHRDLEVRQGQIAHLDHNNANFDPDNLVFLCIPHHDQYDSKTSQSKGFTEGEVRRFRQELDDKVAAGLPGETPKKLDDYRTQTVGQVSTTATEAAIKEQASPNVGSLRPKPNTPPTEQSQPNTPTVPAPTVRNRSPKICIVRNKPKVEWLDLDERYIWRISKIKTKLQGVVFPLYNDPQKSDPGAELEYAKAHLVFSAGGSEDKVIVPFACWIGEEYNWTKLAPGDQKFILLAVTLEKKEFPIATFGTSRDYRGWYTKHSDECPITDYLLELKTYSVELCLLGGGNGEFRQVDKFDLPLVDFKQQT